MAEKDTQTLYAERSKRMEDSIALREPDRVPLALLMGSGPLHLYGSNYKDIMYDQPKALDAFVQYHREFEPDVGMTPATQSGPANEIAGSTMIDWPGRPGTHIPDRSSYQFIEHEYLLAEEYPEFFRDYTGFMLRKYIPRAYGNLKGLSGINFAPGFVLGSDFLGPFCSPEAVESLKRIVEIAEHESAQVALRNETVGKLVEMGFPPYLTGVGECPFDVLGDYFRGTIGSLMDIHSCPDNVLKACDMFADNMIASYGYFNVVDLPVKRVFFPMHKGVDSFMSVGDYRKFYWEPFRKIILALIDMGVTPLLYTEGAYHTRLEVLKDLPPGKVMIHFEDVDMAQAKKILGDTACIGGGISHYLLEHGTVEDVVDEAKRTLDICAPGGGFYIDTDMGLDNCKRANLEALFDTVKTYGKY